MQLIPMKKYRAAFLDGLAQGCLNGFNQSQAYCNCWDTINLINMGRRARTPHIDKEHLTIVPEDINPISTSRHYSSPFTVKTFPRKLPAGQKASAEKQNEADALGIKLDEGHTLVLSYVKSGKNLITDSNQQTAKTKIEEEKE